MSILIALGLSGPNKITDTESLSKFFLISSLQTAEIFLLLHFVRHTGIVVSTYGYT